MTAVDALSPSEQTVLVLPGPATWVPEPRAECESVLPEAPTPQARVPGGRHAKPSGRAARRTVRRSRRWVDHLLTGGAVLGVVVTAVTVGAAVTGLRPLVVRSGSMEPVIATGGMVLVRTVAASEIEVGDVVAVDRPDHTRVIHRVVSVQHRGAAAQLALKGDANTDNDPVPVVVTTAGRLVFTAPWLGRVGPFLSSAKGGFLLGWLVAVVMLAVLRREPH